MKFHEFTKFHGNFSWNSMEFHQPQFHEIPWKIPWIDGTIFAREVKVIGTEWSSYECIIMVFWTLKTEILIFIGAASYTAWASKCASRWPLPKIPLALKKKSIKLIDRAVREVCAEYHKLPFKQVLFRFLGNCSRKNQCQILIFRWPVCCRRFLIWPTHRTQRVSAQSLT
jgi:hypothetical protein